MASFVPIIHFRSNGGDFLSPAFTYFAGITSPSGQPVLVTVRAPRPPPRPCPPPGPPAPPPGPPGPPRPCPPCPPPAGACATAIVVASATAMKIANTLTARVKFIQPPN